MMWNVNKNGARLARIAVGRYHQAPHALVWLADSFLALNWGRFRWCSLTCELSFFWILYVVSILTSLREVLYRFSCVGISECVKICVDEKMAGNRADSLRSLSPVAPCPHMALWLDFSRNEISRCADSKITFSFFRWIHPCIDCLNPSVGPIVLCCVVLVTYEQLLFSSWTFISTFLCVLAVVAGHAHGRNFLLVLRCVCLFVAFGCCGVVFVWQLLCVVVILGSLNSKEKEITLVPQKVCFGRDRCVY